MKFCNKLFTPPHLIFTLLLALSVLIGCQVESDDSGSSEPTKKTFTITFDANGGSGEMKALTTEEGTEIILTANAFTREGFTFSGWATTSDGNIVLKDEAKIKLTADITLYAQWTEIGKVEKVTFSATGDVDYNEKITLTCGTDGAAIYYLLVAGTDSLTAEEVLSSKQKYSEPIAITENAVIAAVAVKDGMKDSETATATFTVKTYTVTFETEHGTAPAKIEGLKKGDKLTEEQLKALENVTGYRFDGWFDGETQFTTEMEITSNLTLTAKWLVTYTITFDANGGTGSVASITEVAGTEITLPESTFTKDGYIFAGWATTADGSVSYYDKATITLTGNITLYAKYGMTATAAIAEISGFTDGEEHTVTVAGTITADNLTAIKEAINGNSNHPQIILDLGGTTGLTEIPSETFNNCNYLTGVNIPNCVTSIGYRAFANCSHLTSAEIPNSVTSIGEYAFYYSGLSSVTIPNSVTSISKSAFSGCRRLTSIIIPDSITSIDSDVFSYCELLTSVTIPDTVTSIGDSAFANCLSLTDVNIPSSVTSIGGSAFTYCESLTSVNIPNSVASIGKSAFSVCSKLTSITIPDGVTSTDSTFSGCSSLTTVTIPKSIASIGFATFYQCGNLTTINYKGSKEDWDKIKIEPLYNDALLNAPIYCTDGIVITASKAAEFIKSLEPGDYRIAVNGEATAENITAIGETFSDDFDVWISLNLSGTTGLTEIPKSAFRGYYRLYGMVLPAGIKSIGDGAFEGCTYLNDLIIPDGVTLIDSYAFSYCSGLRLIVIPSSVESIGDNAFEKVGSLTVKYKGSETEWNALKDKIGSNNDDFLNATMVYDYTGE